MLVVDVDEPAAAFADQILEGGVNLSIDKTFLQRLGHRVLVCRRLQGFTRSAKKVFAQSNRGSLIGRHNMPSAFEDNTRSARLQTNQ